jgi:hypothetical protein
VSVQAFVWWLIPLVATAVAVGWVVWVSRPRPPADTHDSLAEHEKFRRAMDRRTRRAPADQIDDTDDDRTP